jgi:hypothetical protein
MFMYRLSPRCHPAVAVDSEANAALVDLKLKGIVASEGEEALQRQMERGSTLTFL